MKIFAYFSNWVVYKRVPGKDLYHIKNLVLDTECYLSTEDFKFSRKLNGWRNPYSVRGGRGWRQTRLLLQKLQRYEVIRTDHGIIKNDGGYLITLIKTGNTTSKRIASIIANSLLMLMFIPILMLGLYMYIHPTSVTAEAGGITKLVYDHSFFASIFINALGVIGGALAHEVAHANAARSTRGGRVFEYGMMLSFPPGFYTLMDVREKSTIKALQVLAAGCEGNLFFAGVLLIVGSYICPTLRSFFFEPAAINILMACLNLTPFSGTTDGSKILAIILGLEEDELERTKVLIRNRRYRRLLANAGTTGRVKLAACCILIFLQMFFPLLILMNIVTWVGMFL